MDASKPFSMYGYIGKIDAEDGIVGVATPMGVFFLLGSRVENMEHMAKLAMIAHEEKPEANIRVCHFKVKIVETLSLKEVVDKADQIFADLILKL